MKVKINPNEKLEDLQCKGLMLLQDKDNYCFTTDSVLLANFVHCPKSAKVVELCSGSGVISILLCAKLDLQHVDMVELQESLCEMSTRSVAYNDMQQKIHAYNMPLQQAHTVLKQGSYDVVVSNPPYYKIVGAPTNGSENVSLAKHELKMNLTDLVVEADKLLKYGGKFYFIHRADRLDEIIDALNRHNLGAKVIQLIQPKPDKPAHLVLIQAVKGAKFGVQILPMLYLNNMDGSINEKVAKIYNSNV